MKKKIIICVLLVVAVIVGAIFLFSGIGGSDVEEGKTMSDINKDIVEYTWEDFNSLKGSEQMAFQNSFDSSEAFEEWMNNAQPADDGSEESEDPWENGGKKPEEYTWKEFNDLEKGQQIHFQFAFEEEDGFDKWLKENEPKDK